MFSAAKFFPIVSQLGAYLKQGMDHYADLRAAGKSAGPEVISVYLAVKMAPWNPKVGNVELLDDETKAAGARFLAGIAVNIANT